MEIKPRNISGLLMAVHAKRDYLVLQINDGSINFTVENGNGPVSTIFRPSTPDYFCDGQWHSIIGKYTKLGSYQPLLDAFVILRQARTANPSSGRASEILGGAKIFPIDSRKIAKTSKTPKKKDPKFQPKKKTIKRARIPKNPKKSAKLSKYPKKSEKIVKIPKKSGKKTQNHWKFKKKTQKFLIIKKKSNFEKTKEPESLETETKSKNP